MLVTERDLHSAPAAPEAATFGITDLWRVIGRHKLIVVAAVLVGVVGGLFFSKVTPRAYIAEAVLLAEPLSPRMATDMRPGRAEQPPDPAATRTIVEAIGSRPIIEGALNRLSPSIRVELQEAADLTGQRSPACPAAGGSEAGTIGTEVLQAVLGALCDLFSPASPTDALLEGSKHETWRLSDFVLRRLQIDNGGRSYVIRIRFASSSPEAAAAIPNAVAEEYLAFRAEQSAGDDNRVIAGLQGRLLSLRLELDNAERTAQQTREQVRLQELRSGVLTEPQTAALRNQLIEAQTRRTQAESRLEAAQSAGHGSASTEVLSSRLIQELRRQQAEQRRQEAQLVEMMGPSHPTVRAARRELAELDRTIAVESRRIIDSLQSEVAAARAQEQGIIQALRTQENAIAQSAEAHVRLRQAERQTQAIAQVYEHFLLRSRELAGRQNVPEQQVRLLSSARIPLRPTGPGPRMLAAFGAIGGMLLGMSVAVLTARRREKTDPLVMSRKAADDALSVSIVPKVPNLTTNSSRYVAENPSSPYAESLHWIRAALRGRFAGRRRRVIAVASALPGAGKSSFCQGLATAMMLAGESTVVVDCDLRKPYGEIVSACGDRQALTGFSDLGAVLHPASGGQPDVVRFLHGRAHPHAILSSHRFGALIEMLASSYDYVILDNTPLMVAADSLFVAANADECLMVANWKDPSRELIRAAVADLRARGIHVTSLIVNRAEIRGKDTGLYRSSYAEGAVLPLPAAPEPGPTHGVARA